MDQVMRVVKQATFRLAIIETLRALCVTITLGFALLVAIRLVERLGGVVVPWADIVPGVFVVAVIGAVVWAFATRSRPIAAARELDERADLRESLSTAICVQSERDPWSQLIVRHAAERASSVRVARAIPIQTPRLAPAPFCAALALALIWFTVPRVDAWGVAARRDNSAREEQQIQEVRTEFEQGKKKIEEMLAQANIKLEEGEGEKSGADREAPKSLEEARRESVRRLTDMAERLEQLRAGEKGQVMDALKDRMGRLKSPGPGELTDIARSMARANFSQAKDDLEKLAQKLGENSELTPEQKEELRKQLENMSGQLSKLAADRGELSKALEQMGMDGRLAADPEALKKAIEQAANEMTPEQKSQLEKMLQQAQAQQEMGDKLGNMADAMAKMSRGASERGMTGEGMQGLEQLAEALSEMELSQADLSALDAALSECRGQLAGQCEGLSQCMGGGNGDGMPMIGEWRAGESDGRMGLGSGGPGQGSGASGPAEEQIDFAIEKRKANVQTGQGPIIGTKLVQGSQIRGESVAEFSAVVEASSQAAAEALETMQVQREHHDVVKHYFGTLNAKVKAEQAGGGSSGSK
ncbi:MAG: hypothetical protein KF912_12855 [Phycisphaeraceae bacterium]|nr:hypothetical protein [Phycisphaeraceae bacterium]